MGKEHIATLSLCSVFDPEGHTDLIRSGKRTAFGEE